MSENCPILDVIMMRTTTETTQSGVNAMGAGHTDFCPYVSYMEALVDGNDISRYDDLGPDDDSTDSEIRWYPMRIRHSNARKAFDVRQALYEKGFTTYLRLEYSEQVKKQELHVIAKPVFTNLIFVQVRKKIIRKLKGCDSSLTSLQFMTKVKHDKYERTEVLSVPDREMMNFIDAETREDPNQQRKRWQYSDNLAKPGRKVRILRGPFVGIKGEIKNFKTHRVVVVKLDGLGLANVITRVPKKDLEFYDEV